MPKSEIAVGIDLGAHALKAVMLRKRGTHVAVLRAGSVELGDLAFLEDSERKDKRVAELLKVLLRQTRIRRHSVGVGLAGREYFAKYLHVPPAPPQKLRKLIQYEVSEDPASGTREQTADFWLLDLPAKGEEFTVLVALARNDTLRNRLRLLKQAGLSTNGLTLDAVALYNSYVHSMDEDIYNDRTSLLVDIGSRHMDVVVQRNAKLLFVRNLTVGGQRCSESVQEEFHLPIKEAEELKLAQGAILPRHFDAAAEVDTATPEARLSAALLEPAEAIYDTLQATIKYCQTQTRMRDLRIDEVVLSGRGAYLRGLREFLAHRFHVPVLIHNPYQNVETGALSPRGRDEVLGDAAGYSVAVGLALQQLAEPHQRPITLLPEEVSRRREFLAHEAFLYAAAAVFVLAFGAMVYSSGAATRKAEHDLKMLDIRLDGAEDDVAMFEGHTGRNAILAKQAEALKRLLDTGRRCDEAIAILTRKTADELHIDSVATFTKKPLVSPRRGAEAEESKLTTHLLIEGRVEEKHRGEEILEARAKALVDAFLASLLAEKHLYSEGKVIEYPKPREALRTFKIIVYFAAPFYGGLQEYVRR